MRHIIKRLKWLVVLPLISLSIKSLGQQSFKYRADLDSIPASGFYKISLSPQLLAKSGANLADVRIATKEGRQVPYMFGNMLPRVSKFILLPQLPVVNKSDTSVTYIVGNKSGYTLNQLCLQLRNTEVKRTLFLSGSDDQKTWYAIKENMSLVPSESGDSKGTYVQLLNFPFSTYKYFKIQINTDHKEPVAITGVGIYAWQTTIPAYVGLPRPIIAQHDSDKVSYVTLKFKEPYVVNKLSLNLTGSKFYNRALKVFDGSNQLLYDGYVYSAKPAELLVAAKTNTIKLQISNDDNPSLVVAGANAWQLDQQLISYLEAGKRYHLLFGDQKASMPIYDLGAFVDSVTQHPLISVGHKAITSIAHKAVQKENDKLPNWAIWGAIGAALVVLLALTFKMTQEVNKRAAENK